MSIKNFFRGLIYKEYDKFAEDMGFSDWKAAYDNTFFIFHIPVDAQWSATELPNKSWAVWNDVGQPPYSFKVFPSWVEAITYLHNIFEQEKYSEECWAPEGYEPGENVFIKPPDKNKRED